MYPFNVFEGRALCRRDSYGQVTTEGEVRWQSVGVGTLAGAQGRGEGGVYVQYSIVIGRRNARGNYRDLERAGKSGEVWAPVGEAPARWNFGFAVGRGLPACM